MRKTFFSLALLGAIAAVPAFAQTAPTAPDRTTPNAATDSVTRPRTPDAGTGAATPNRGSDSNAAARVDDGSRTATTPAAGANSFTEGQAKSRIEAAGFTNVSDLQKDDQGVWRGRAQQGAQQVSVALDYQGNVVPGGR